VRVFSLTMNGREDAVRMFEPPPADPVPELTPQPARNPRSVAVMHGRDLRARQWMYDWLRRIGLEPLEWAHLIKLTKKGAPSNREAVGAAFETAQAVVVLFTPDEIGTLHPDLVDGGDDSGAQPRLNVILEAGMALQSHPDQTVLVEIGSTRKISDIDGLNVARLTGDARDLNGLASRLEGAGCPVDKTAGDWLEVEELGALEALHRNASVKPAAAPGGVAAFGREASFYLAFRACGAQIQYRDRGDEGWGQWRDIGSVDEEPIGLAASSIGDNHVEVFVLLPSGEVFRNRRWKGNWQSAFHSLGSPFSKGGATRIGAGSNGKGHEEVFVESADGEIGHIWWAGDWHKNDDPLTRLGDGWWRF